MWYIYGKSIVIYLGIFHHVSIGKFPHFRTSTSTWLPNGWAQPRRESVVRSVGQWIMAQIFPLFLSHWFGKTHGFFSWIFPSHVWSRKIRPLKSSPERFAGSKNATTGRGLSQNTTCRHGFWAVNCAVNMVNDDDQFMRNQMKPPDCTYNYWLVVWNHGILWLSIYWECHHPNGPNPSFLFIFQRGWLKHVETTNQITIMTKITMSHYQSLLTTTNHY